MSPLEPAAALTRPTPGLASIPRVGAGFRLQWEPAQACFVLLYPEGMVRLNQSAGEILRRCDGQRDTAAIVADLEAAFCATGLEADVIAFIAMAGAQHWLAWDALP
jgi:pyrroloquinoline quinone biosynthesis protein D